MFIYIHLEAAHAVTVFFLQMVINQYPFL